MPAARVLQEHGRQIAQLLRGDSQPLSEQEQAVVLQSAFSYFDHDVVVPAWNAAFILDSDAAALSAVEIIEFVKSQLLELRYHDELLERELTQLYAQLQEPRWTSRIADDSDRLFWLSARNSTNPSTAAMALA